MSVAGIRRALRSEEGFTLAELAVATVVLTIVLLAVGGLMFSTTVTQRTVSAVSQATSSAQTAATVIQARLRNATTMQLTTVDGTDQLLVARVAGTGGAVSFECAAWYFAADEHQLRSTSWATAGSTPLPTGAAGVASWALLVDGVHPVSGSTTVFAPPSGSTIAAAFEVVSNADNEPTRVQFTAVLSGGTGGGTECWD